MSQNKIKFCYPFKESYLDYPSKRGSCVSVFVVGCDHNCDGCHNVELQSFDYSGDDVRETSYDELVRLLIDECEEMDTNKITILGGEPLHPRNIQATKYILNELSQLYNICIYTGYTDKYVSSQNLEGFKYIKTGKFQRDLEIASFKNDDYFQLASTNQRILNQNLKCITKNGKLKY